MTKKKIAVIGLGYVGLPLARLFATKYPVVGYDINSLRIAELKDAKDSTLEVSNALLASVLAAKNPLDEDAVELMSYQHANKEINNNNKWFLNDVNAEQKGLYCTDSISDISNANIYIITVPTPIDKNNSPDLTFLYRASEAVGNVLNIGDIVIYESTVYPGVTEEECVPILEKTSKLKFNEDFFCGYSPERINPGDKEKTVENILKVTSGSTPEIGKVVDDLYKSVIVAGTYLAPNIKVAEAAKVIENAQRDINIAFMNELAKIFSIMDLDTQEVLRAAGTKWNFLPFKPGLVGGHCIGVDPFYLAQKAQEIGYHSELILTARRLNDSMGAFVASQVVKLMIQKGHLIKGAKVLNLGFAFKENCPDVRNTKVIDVIQSLEEYGIEVITYDPWVNREEVFRDYGIKTVGAIPECTKFNAAVLSVAHQQFYDLHLDAYLNDDAVVYDVKSVLKKADKRL